MCPQYTRSTDEFHYWIDGARYPTGGLANVVTAPEVARRGYASQILRASLRWMKDELGQSLSTLFPTVYPIYHGLGWRLADDTQRIAGPPTAFRPDAALPHDPGSRLVRRVATAADVDLLAKVYEALARERSGYLDRPRWWWEARVLRLIRDDPSWIGLWYGSDRALAGYVVYWFDGPNATQLIVHEAVALRPEAYRGILSFLAAHNLASEVILATGRDVPWRSMVSNPHQLKVRVDDEGSCMLRVVDFPTAIARRAFVADGDIPPVVLQVVDENASWNHGPWRLSAEDRRWDAKANPGARPDAVADISTIGALFTGFLTVADASAAGLLQADDRTQPTLEALFRTKYPPTSRDHF